MKKICAEIIYSWIFTRKTLLITVACFANHSIKLNFWRNSILNNTSRINIFLKNPSELKGVLQIEFEGVIF